MAVRDLHDEFDNLHAFTWRSRRAWPADDYIEIFVEGEADVRLYRRLIGPTLGRKIQFINADGCKSAVARMRNRRLATAGGQLNRRFNRAYCLLDGEETSQAGEPGMITYRGIGIQNGMDLWPYLNGGYRRIDDREGVLFLTFWEPENLYPLFTKFFDLMFEMWTKPREMFGESLPVEKAWKVLQRALVLAELRRFAKFHNVEHKAFEQSMGPLAGFAPLLPSLNGAIAALENPCPKLCPEQFTSPRDIIRSEIRPLRTRIDAIMDGSEDIEGFNWGHVASCDGKALYKFAFRGDAGYENEFQRQLCVNGFSTYFQANLVSAMVGNQYLLPYPEDMMRAGPKDEFTFRDGSYSLVARRRSTALVPFVLPRPYGYRF